MCMVMLLFQMSVCLKDPALPAATFTKIFLDKSYKNVHISTCDGTLVLAHASVLAVISTKLKRVFSQSTSEPYRINTPNVTSKTWEIIIEFIHTGSVALPPGFNVYKLYETCESMQMEPLLKYFSDGLLACCK